MREPAPAARTRSPTRSVDRSVIPTMLALRPSVSGETTNVNGQDVAGGPGFEPGIKVPKTLVIPFHHPPMEETDTPGVVT